jgi:Ca-activated chloride channel family protein
MNLTFVLDTSGSMSGKSIQLLREASLEIAGQLRAGDTASVVEWDTTNTWSLANHKVSGPRDRRLARVLRRVRANGGTDLHGGLSSGYELARRTWDPQAINRLVLVSDGGANVGVLDTDLIAENASLGGEDGIYLVGVGVGDANTYHDLLMDAVTDAGKGASVFLSNQDDIDELFDARFLETMAVAARDVRVELTMPPGFEIVRFSGEEYSTVAEEIEPQHLAPNDVMVFHQEIETCAPALLEAGAGEAAPQVHVRLTWHDRDDHELQAIERDYDFAELLAEPDPHLLEGAAVFAYAEGLQAYQRSGDPRDLAPAYAEVQAAQRALPGDPDLAEIAAILSKLMGDLQLQ